MSMTSMNRTLYEPYVADELVVVVANNTEELEYARDILGPKAAAGASAVVIVSQELASGPHCPVLDELRTLDIGIQPSTHEDPLQGMRAFVDEYRRITDFLNRSAVDETDYELAEPDASFDTHARHTNM